MAKPIDIQEFLHILKQAIDPDNPLIDSIQLFMDANNDLIAGIHNEKDPGAVEQFQIVDFDGYVTSPVGNQAIDLLSGHFFKSTPDQDATWTTASARQGWLVWLHVDNTATKTITFGAGFTDVDAITATGIQNKLLYYDGATWREIKIGGGGNTYYQLGIQWGEVFRWVFKMVDSADFATPETGKTVTVEMSQDGAGFAGLTGAPAITEIGSGWYWVDVPATDMEIASAVLKATAAGCAQTDFSFYL